MIEYLYNAIKATAGQDIVVEAAITDEAGECIDTGCCFVLHADDDMIQVSGVYLAEEGLWRFTVPAEATWNMQGRYWYCIQCSGQNLCFKQPIYLV